MAAKQHEGWMVFEEGEEVKEIFFLVRAKVIDGAVFFLVVVARVPILDGGVDTKLESEVPEGISNRGSRGCSKVWGNFVADAICDMVGGVVVGAEAVGGGGGGGGGGYQQGCCRHVH